MQLSRRVLLKLCILSIRTCAPAACPHPYGVLAYLDIQSDQLSGGVAVT